MTLDLDALPDDVDALHRLIHELAAQQDGAQAELAQAQTEIQRLRFIVAPPIVSTICSPGTGPALPSCLDRRAIRQRLRAGYVRIARSRALRGRPNYEPRRARRCPARPTAPRSSLGHRFSANGGPNNCLAPWRIVSPKRGRVRSAGFAFFRSTRGRPCASLGHRNQTILPHKFRRKVRFRLGYAD